jgi:streptogramin lyase
MKLKTGSLLAALAILACIILPSADAQKITETFYFPGVFNGDFASLDTGLYGAASNSKGLEVFTFGVDGCQGLNIYKAGAASIAEPAQALPKPFCPEGLATDSDGNFWFVDTGNQAVGVMNTKGVITEYPSPESESCDIDMVGCVILEGGIVQGSDGAMWVSGRITVRVNQGPIAVTEPLVASFASNGTFTYYPITVGSPEQTAIGTSMATGSDGNVYFLGIEHIFKVTPAGQATAYSLGSNCETAPPYFQGALTLGPDGNIWFITNCGATYPNNFIGNITPAGEITTFPIATSAAALATGSDGAIWFTNAASYEIGRITTSGSVTYITVPTNDFPYYTGCAGTPVGTGMGPIFPGLKGTLQFYGTTYNSVGPYYCNYVGSFTPTAPGEDRQEEASQDKPKPDVTVDCGDAGVLRCGLTLNAVGDTEPNKGGFYSEIDARLQYTDYSEEGLSIGYIIVIPFGQCNINDSNGNPVDMAYDVQPVGVAPQKEPQLPYGMEVYEFLGVSAKATGATYGQKYACTFEWELSQVLNGTGSILITKTLTIEGYVGP